MEQEVRNAVGELEEGNIIVYPTDTVWGIGCDATNAEAVQKIYQLKNREESKSLVILVSSLEMLKKYIPDVPQKALSLLEETKKPTTIIYKNPNGLAKNTIATDNSVAIRIPNHDFCQSLVTTFDKPIVSTSANISGNPTPKSFSEIDTPILVGADYVVNLEREKITDKSSTILRIVGDEIEVIRA